MKIFDRLEEEADRLMKQEGKTIKAIFLGSKEYNQLIEELLDIRETPKEQRASERKSLSEFDIFINDDVRVIKTAKDSEFRVDAKTTQLFN